MISNVSDQVSVNEVIKPSVAELFTDHGIVSFQFITTLKSPPKIKRLVYYFSKGDFDRLRSVVRGCKPVEHNFFRLLRDQRRLATMERHSTCCCGRFRPKKETQRTETNPLDKRLDNQSQPQKRIDTQENSDKIPQITCERNFHHSAPKSSANFEKVETRFSLIWKQH